MENTVIYTSNRNFGIKLYMDLPRIIPSLKSWLFFLLFVTTFKCQEIRDFPPLFRVSENKPLNTDPSQSTCGIPTRTAYCKSSKFQESIEQCRQDFCMQDCPRRTFLPTHISLFEGATGFGVCVTKDTVNGRPNAPPGGYAAVFRVGQMCYITPSSMPVLGANGAFTIQFWVLLDADNQGTVIEKTTTEGETIFRLRLSTSKLTVFYRTDTDVNSVSFSENLLPNVWTNIAVQVTPQEVYDSTLSYYVNGLRAGYTASGTETLTAMVRDISTGRIRIGQKVDGTDQFVGMLQDFRFYRETLTNREIQEVYDGLLPEVRIQTTCRCPATHPRVKSLQTIYCIRNGVPDNTGDEVIRLNQYAHPLQFLNDGDFNSYWISTPLEDVTVQVDLGDQYQVFYIVMQFYSPLPKVVTIERKKSATSPWERWALYAEDCQLAFGMPNNGSLTTSSSVNCVQFGSKTLSDITFNVLTLEPVPRPGVHEFYTTPALKEFVKAYQVRARLQGHFLVTHPRHKYYGIFEFTATGRCNCHGHAGTCNSFLTPYQCNCYSDSFTDGTQCERCQPLYNDKPFRAGDEIQAYNCKACVCYDHADSCIYNSTLDDFPNEHDRGGGGVCVDCKHNTQGRRCDECKPMYFRPEGKSLYAEDVCESCDCLPNGVPVGESLLCEQVGGQCTCKDQVEGRQCDQCVTGYFNLQASNPAGCENCGCSENGTVNGDISCHQTIGQCNCKQNVRGLRCDNCNYGYFGLAALNPLGCAACECNPTGSTDLYCNPASGQCQCKEHITGRQCDQCEDGFYSFDSGCLPCNCDSDGSNAGTFCDKVSGVCDCKSNVHGDKCDECKDGYYSLGSSEADGCQSCGCDEAGISANGTLTKCDKTIGDCQCKPNVEGRSCNQCKPNTFNLTESNPEGCETCGCDGSGTMLGGETDPDLLTCDQNNGQCTCLNNRYGRRCESCQEGFYINSNPGGGCEPCNCNSEGVTSTTAPCDPITGQCPCKGDGWYYAGRECNQCAEGYFGFNRQGCSPCNCNPIGSNPEIPCDINTGQCECKEFTEGLRCDACKPGTSNLEAGNPFGCSKVPTQQPPPSYRPISPTTLNLYWVEPDYPNGVIQRYKLYRNGQPIVEIETTPGAKITSYNDTGLAPFTEYQYFVEARNNYGTTRSPTVTFRTPSGTPEGSLALVVGSHGSRTATFSWTRPTLANGVIQRYILTSVSLSNPDPPVEYYSGLALTYSPTNLIPFTNYNFTITACTLGGCLFSEPANVITKEALPEGQQPPDITALSETELFVQWQPPTEPNGIIIFYELYMRGELQSDGSREPVETKIFNPAGQYNPRPTLSPQENALTPPATSHNVTELAPYTIYEFQVLSENNIGKTASTWISGRTLEAAPESMPTPVVVAISSTVLNITWSEPTNKEARGEVIIYNVYLFKENNLTVSPHAPPFQWTKVDQVLPPASHYLAGPFKAYSTQTFIIELCNSIGCVNSTNVNGLTLLAAPSGVQPPVAKGYNSTVMSVDWARPLEPNAPSWSYSLKRSAAAFNYPPLKVNTGVRFTGSGYFLFESNTIPEGVGFTGINLWFKTKKKEGLILYAASEGAQEEFISLRIHNGRPWFLFDTQGCPVAIEPDPEADNNKRYDDNQWHLVEARRSSTVAEIIVDNQYKGCFVIVTTTDDEGLPYNDNKWHYAEASRNGTYGLLRLDRQWKGDRSAAGNEEQCVVPGRVIGKNTGVYIGGLPEDFILPDRSNLQDSRAEIQKQNFIGCLRDIRIQRQTEPELWESVDWDNVVETSYTREAWEGCPSEMDPDSGFLYRGEGYIIYEQSNFIGAPRGNSNYRVDITVRTETNNGLLLFCYGADNVFMLLQMVSGGLHFEFGANQIKGALIYDGSQVKICDGAWHRIVIDQDKYQTVLAIDGQNIMTIPATNPGATTTEFKISSPMYVGGIKPGSEAEDYIKRHNMDTIVQGSFSGCITPVFRVLKQFDIILIKESLNIDFDGCPPEKVEPNPCTPTAVYNIYNGTRNQTYDDELKPYTEYLYQLDVINEGGTTSSNWVRGRSAQGVPIGVPTPTSVQLLPNNIIHVTWGEPELSTGVLTGYALAAYDLDFPETPPVMTYFNSTYEIPTATMTPPGYKFNTDSGNITAAVSFTNYTIKLVVCTVAGCSESAEGINITTKETVPEEMHPPETIESGGKYLLLGWKLPEKPNGIITGYILYMNGREIYKGGQMQYNVTNLLVFTAYPFIISVCNRAGCSNSSSITISTAQLPPTFVVSPTLTVLGTKRIKSEWRTPADLNGKLERYLLHASVEPSQLGEEVYNSTDLFLFYTIRDLIPGTTYFISLGACTGGGCTFSQPSQATTEESAPEGVIDPTAVSPKPSELNITWVEPKFPNGNITLYVLYHNGLEIFRSRTEKQYLLENLLPWSLHVFTLQVCTQVGCSSSNDVEARTQEAPPEGVVGIAVSVLDPRTVQAEWNSPEVPNGRLYYDVYFEGLFYIDPENWDYNTVSDRRSLHRGTEYDIPVKIDSLIPFSSYYVQLNSSNTKGYLLSNTVQVNMPMGSPDGVKDPTLTSPTPDTVRATWQVAGRANADQEPVYQLQFQESLPNSEIEDLFNQATTATTYTKRNLQPFTEYQFRLIASNNYGQTLTEWIPVITKQDKPEGVDPPMTSNVQARSVKVRWEPPYKSHGILTAYKLYQNDTLVKTVLSNITDILVLELTPSTVYTYKVEACTIAGCTGSEASRPVTTLKAAPEEIQAPSLVSQRPTSVLIVWNEPLAPNGDILSYTIERRVSGNEAISTVATFTSVDQKQYEDQSPDIIPNDNYDYRIVAVNSAGQGTSPWSSVKTKPARPGGVLAPSVEVLDSKSVKVSWQPPIQPNGRVESYIIKLPNPRIEIRNISVTSVVVENLIPFTEYSITLTTCTDGGCTESTPTVITTNPSIPSGVEPPKATPHSQTYISVLWTLPKRPNGPNLRYDLQRMKVRQPLDLEADDFDSWSNIYSGTDLYYDDRSLTIFTTYRYRITTYNQYGQATSEPSQEVTTFGGTPTKAATVTARTVNHTSIEVRWTTPNVFELQGGVSQYLVNLTTNEHKYSESFSPNVSMAVITSLEPNKVYEIRVTIVVHGGDTVTSLPVFGVTEDGAPVGMDPPMFVPVNETALRIVWSAPQQPNGQISAYNIYVDGVKIETGMNTAGSYVVHDLQPYTIYLFQVEVCTVYACVKSNATRGTTAEAVPQGIVPPSVQASGPNEIQVNWSPPGKANGIILRYELMRKSYVPCSKATGTESQQEENVKCNYFECGIQESFCGNQCYTGPKTCCNGALHDNKQGYECCDTNYIPKKNSATDVCCGGRFYTQLENHQCCGGRYLEVLPGHICCKDPVQDRVDVGLGDKCCASIPYSSSGSQICCKDLLQDKYGKQCCGGKAVSQTRVCCGDEKDGAAFPSNSNKFCCGEEYVDQSLSVCCSSETGESKAHMYSSSAERLNANQKCCGKERISAGLSCCNGRGYNPFSHACADVSNREAGCGKGTICIGTQSSTAFCDRCDFDRTQKSCGSYTPAASTSPSVPVAPPPNEGELCLGDPEKVYSGQGLTFTDTLLTPFTEYHYAVVAVNGAGSGMSEYSSTTTAQAVPENVSRPKAQIEGEKYDTIYLTWDPPVKPNGEIIRYSLMRDGVEIFRDPVKREYIDNNAIQPYRTYTYILTVCTIMGCAESQPVKVATLEAKPEGLSAPTVSTPSATVQELSWTAPSKPNGLIVDYAIILVTQETTKSLGPDVFEYTVTGLEPYGEYTYKLRACTSKACTESESVTARTLEDKPTGVHAPSLLIVSSSLVEIFWQTPDNPKGIITKYKIYKSSRGLPYTTFYETTDNKILNTTDESIIGDSRYTYLLEAATSAGRTNSTPSIIDIPRITPTGIPAPTIQVQSATSVIVEWSSPTNPNGEIDQYRILLNTATSSAVSEGVGRLTRYTMNGLDPYTVYAVRIQACLKNVQNGCGTGPASTARTLEDAPTDLEAPKLVAKASNVVEISWSPPLKPNGVVTGYRVYRRNYGTDVPGLIINVVDGNTEQFTNAADLLPFTRYEYNIIAVNAEGETTSPWAGVRTLEAPPQVLHPPTITGISAYLISVSWQAPLKTNGIITVYRVEYKAELNDPTAQAVVQSVTVPSDELATSFSGLQPYTSYEVRVVAVNSAGEVASDWSQGTTSQAPPADVGPFEVEKITTGTSVILRWSPPLQPNGVVNNYLIFEEGNINAIYQGLNREFEYRRLTPYTDYTVQLEACTIGGCGRSNKQIIRTAEIAPSNQPAPVISNTNSTAVALKWSNPINPFGEILMYQVLRRADIIATRRKRALSNPEIVYQTTDTTKDSYEYTDTNLQPYTKYEYQIKSTNSKGSTSSPWQVVETAQSPPEGIAKPVVTYVPNHFSQLRISWSAPAKANGVVQSYQLQRNNSIPWSFGPNDRMEYLDNGLLAFTTYNYQIFVCTGGGCTASAPTFAQTQESSPYYVGPPTLQTLSSTAITASWIKPQVTNGDIREYQLKLDNVTVYTGQAMQYTATALTPYQAYTFRILACTTGGCSGSDSVTGRPFEDVPAGMKVPTLRVTSSTSIEIRWEPPTRPNGIITAYDLRRDGTLIDTTQNLRYTDYEVQAGREYTYRVTALNSKGSTVSPPATTVTFSSSPSGLAPPQLEALTSTSIRASWSPPLAPNGEIYNYTLYEDDNIVFSEMLLNTVVTGLDFWTEYSFRVQACTSHGCTMSDPAKIKTLQAPPLGMASPKLTAYADSSGAHSGVLVEWVPPRRPNGIISRYEVYRRNSTGLPPTTSGGSRKLVYNGSLERYLDRDLTLKPYTDYEYMATAFNSQGQVSSVWEIVKTKEAPPNGIPSPKIKRTTHDTITIQIEEPLQPNGYIINYNVYLDGDLIIKSRSLLIEIGEINPLNPATKYVIAIDACTAGGCTRSPSVTATTVARHPTGQDPPKVVSVTTTSMKIEWKPPTEANGVVQTYKLRMRSACPQPYADGDDSVEIPCSEGPWVDKARGMIFEASILGLTPYTAYEYQLDVENEAGGLEVPVTTMNHTLPAAPTYRSEFPPRLTPTGNVIVANWTMSFNINGEVVRFDLYKDGQIEYTGYKTTHNVYRDSSRYTTYEFQVKLYTDQGETQTPLLIFDPTKPDYIMVVTTTGTTPVTEKQSSTSLPVYQEVWFIALMAIIALIILFIGLAVCLKNTGHKVPYIRERMPLQPRQKKSPLPSMNYYDGVIQTTEIPVANGHLTPSPHPYGTGNSHEPAHVGYINPAYSHISSQSRPNSMIDLNLDKMSHKSSHWDDEEDYSEEADSPYWNGHLPPRDSGHHSIGYTDDFESPNMGGVSVLKEHTMFTDTHL